MSEGMTSSRRAEVVEHRAPPATPPRAACPHQQHVPGGLSDAELVATPPEVKRCVCRSEDARQPLLQGAVGAVSSLDDGKELFHRHLATCGGRRVGAGRADAASRERSALPY